MRLALIWNNISRARDVALLLLRLNMGLLFLSTGWGKIHDLAKVTSFFEELHIPFPAANAVLVSITELVGGSALLIGLATRLAALPLMITMFVAIITARASDIGGITDLAGIEEVTYALVLFAIFILGPGRASVDHLIARRFA